MANDLLSQDRGCNKLFEVDTGVDTELVTEKDQILRANISGGTFMTGERTATEAGDGGIEAVNSHFQSSIGVRHAEAAGIMKMQSDLKFRPALAERTNGPFDAFRSCPGHRVIESHTLNRRVVFGSDNESALDSRYESLDGNVTFEIAAEGGLDQRAFNWEPVGRQDRGETILNLVILLEIDLLVAQHKFFRRRQNDRLLKAEAVPVRDCWLEVLSRLDRDQCIAHPGGCGCHPPLGRRRPTPAHALD